MPDLGIPTNIPNTHPIDRIEPSQNTDQNKKEKNQKNEQLGKKEQKERKSPIGLSKKNNPSGDKPSVNAKNKEKHQASKMGKGEIIDITV